MTTLPIYRPEQPVLDGLKAAVQAAVHPGGSPIRVDVEVVNSDLSSPMCLLGSPSTQRQSPAMSRHDMLVVVDTQLTFIANAVSLARECRARAYNDILGRTSAGWYAPLTVSGFAVIDRSTPDVSVPAAVVGGDWANAVLTVRLTLQPTS